MKDRAYAKINLSLNITGVREDGYHTLESVFLPIDFYDTITIDKSHRMSYSCNSKSIRFDDSNTVVKAINLMKEKYNITDNFSVVLEKHIPMQGGLAGGSTDASSVIRILNEMYNLNIDDETARELCMSIGADVYFTYISKPSIVKGIGEIIEPIEVKKDYYVLLVKPSHGVSTAACYKAMDLESCPHPDIDRLVKALKDGDDLNELLGNSMEPAAIDITPAIADIKKALIRHGAPNALMSGSGSTVFMICEDEKLTRDLSNIFRHRGWFTRYTKVLK